MAIEIWDYCDKIIRFTYRHEFTNIFNRYCGLTYAFYRDAQVVEFDIYHISKNKRQYVLFSANRIFNIKLLTQKEIMKWKLILNII